MTWSNGRQLTFLDYWGEGQIRINYSYDVDGIRTAKNVEGVQHDYVTQNGKVVRETITQGTTTRILDFIYDESGRPFALIYTNGTADPVTYYYVLNLQGDVVGLIDETGAYAAKYTYNAWGEVLSVTNASGTAISSSTHIANLNPLRYRGYYYDTETGFYYLQSRYYDPVTHRFINADSYVSTDSDHVLASNMFAYCQNNPVLYYDPTGELLLSTCVLVGICIGAVIGAVVGGVYGYNEASEAGVPEEERWKYVVGYGIGGAVVGGVIGGFMGYGIGFLCGASSVSGVALNAIAKGVSGISQTSWGHIITAEHAWSLVTSNITQSGIGALIAQAMKYGAHTLIQQQTNNGVLSNVYEAVYNYLGQTIIVRYAVVEGIIKISDAWVKTR